MRRGQHPSGAAMDGGQHSGPQSERESPPDPAGRPNPPGACRRLRPGLWLAAHHKLDADEVISEHYRLPRLAGGQQIIVGLYEVLPDQSIEGFGDVPLTACE